MVAFVMFSTDRILDMFVRLEAAVRRVKGGIEGDPAEETEMAKTMAIVDHLRDLLFSDGTTAGQS